jgi:hypothetical protein
MSGFPQRNRNAYAGSLNRVYRKGKYFNCPLADGFGVTVRLSTDPRQAESPVPRKN